jgi:pantoate kinase
MMLGDVIAIEAGAVIRLYQAEPIGIEAIERNRRPIHVVEHAELHRMHLLDSEQRAARGWYGRAPRIWSGKGPAASPSWQHQP